MRKIEGKATCGQKAPDCILKDSCLDYKKLKP